VEHISDRMAVMYLGTIVELAWKEMPPFREIAPGHMVACRLAERLSLSGIT